MERSTAFVGAPRRPGRDENRYNLRDRRSEALVDRCETESLAFLTWAPIQDIADSTVLEEIASRHHARPG